MQLKEKFNWFSANKPVYWSMTPIINYYERMKSWSSFAAVDRYYARLGL